MHRNVDPIKTVERINMLRSRAHERSDLERFVERLTEGLGLYEVSQTKGTERCRRTEQRSSRGARQLRLGTSNCGFKY